jgi:DNA-binding NarL/FixJ family response regulator
MRQTIRAVLQLQPDGAAAEELARQLAAGVPITLQLAVVQAVEQGLDPALLARLQARGLSERQAMVLLRDAQGWTRKAIAARLCVSKRTVDWYWEGIRATLDLATRAEARAFVGQVLAEVQGEQASQAEGREEQRAVGEESA